ncbi:MAG TPA: GMC family oxidoreductase N-terminal domain-containing protein [Gemmatimonadaceae bacterium]|nr:GMC family oxidoreductase N-terminal domain-containing protein [Gemmatimonadaceae bacterium]
MLTSETAILSDSERITLNALCDALLPSLDSDDPVALPHFAANARERGVARRVEEMLAVLRDAERSRFRFFLRAVEQPLMTALQTGRAVRFSALSQPDAEAVLISLAQSRIADLRAGFQAIRRLATFNFYSAECGSPDKVWTAMGYSPSANPAAIPPQLKLTRITGDTVLDCDVCVIGSGAGGSVAAGLLAETGNKIIVLEAGSDWQSPDFDQREDPGTRELYLDRGTTSTVDLSMSLLAGAALGGGTIVNWQTSLKLPADVRDEWAETSGCSHFAGESFERSLDSVWERLSIGTEESQHNENNAALQRGCEALGYDSMVIPRNSAECDLSQCGNCVYGCRHGGKQSAAVTYLRDAQRNGDTTIIARCTADKVVITNGEVERVIATATDHSGLRYKVEVRARRIVLACGALHSPALLMRSGVTNSHIGRHLRLHPTTGIGATFADRIEAWRGPPQTIVCGEFSRLRGGYGFRIETAPAHPGLLASSTPWLGSREYRENMQQSGNKALWIILVRDRSSGVVTVDHDGRPVLRYQPASGEQEMFREGIIAARSIAAAAGAQMVQSVHTAPITWQRSGSPNGKGTFDSAVRNARASRNHLGLFSAHQMGTCRMGASPRSAVCDARGEVFGVRGLFIADASAFPGSSGVNPMITIMALAHHTASAMRDG